MPATNELLQEGRYRINQTPTHNGDEKVFEAYDTVRNTNVIVREIPVKFNKVTTLSQQESLKLAFANQAKALTEIEHESLSNVHDYFSEIDRQYLVTEAVEGDSLGELVAKHKKTFPVSQVTDWADELLDALNYLHTRKPSIIHRNVNPKNLKFDQSGKVKLLGVGLGAGPDSEVAAMSQTDSEGLRYSPMEQIWPGLDAASQKVITNSYDDRSERILKEPLDARSDIYSLGATLYFLITGHEPVDPIERSIEILEGKLDPLREPTKVNSQVPAEISDVLMKALEIKRENRYDSALIMRQVLKTAIARVQERGEEETREQKVADDVNRMAAQSKSDEALEEKRREAEAEQKRLEADAAQKQLEADAAQKRLEAEAERHRLEAEAEQKRLEADAEQVRLEAEAELERLQAEANAKQLEAEAEQQRQKEKMQRQLREAEEQRLAAEQAAEAKRLLREKEDAARVETANVAVPEESLLETPVPAEVVAYRDTTDVKEDELAAVLRELEEADAETNASVKPVDNSNHVHEFETAQVAESDAEFDEMFTVPEKTGSSLPMPAIAGAVGLVVVIAIGAWYAMSGSSGTPRPEPPQPVQVSQPAPVESNPATDAIVSSQSEPAATSSPETQTAQPETASKTAPAAKPKKAEVKAEPTKKKVTVDDLINDN